MSEAVATLQGESSPNRRLLSYVPEVIAARVGHLALRGLGATVERSQEGSGAVVSLSSGGMEATFAVSDYNRFAAGTVRGGDEYVISAYVAEEWTPIPERTTHLAENYTGHAVSDAFATTVLTMTHATQGIRRARARAGAALSQLTNYEERARRRYVPDIELGVAATQAHYDHETDSALLEREILGDEHRSYTCGIRNNPSETLDEADSNKLAKVIEMLAIDPEAERVDVLDIGAGWGGMSRAILRAHANAHVTAIVTSENQEAYLRELFADEECADRVTIVRDDYRRFVEDPETNHAYDHIVSLEMVEHVPWQEHTEQFVAAHDHLLKENGSIVMQAITIDEAAEAEYRRRKHGYLRTVVFPEGNLHSERSHRESFARGGFVLEQTYNVTPSYPPHLRDWRGRANDIEGLSEYNRRRFDAYFATCEAALSEYGPAEDVLHLYRRGQVVLAA